MSKFYDALETRSSAEREAAHMAALPQQVAHAQKASSAFASILAGLFATFWMACLFGLVQIAEKNDREGWW